MLQRRLEKELALFGGAPPATDSAPDENDEEDKNQEEDEESEPDAPISGILQNSQLCNAYKPLLCVST